MLRRLTRSTPSETLTIWTGPDGPLEVGSDAIGIEWVGRAGHPTSYALLGARLGPGRELPADGDPLRDSEARRLDRVSIGLPDEYRSAVSEASNGKLGVTAAAHGDVGSSYAAFKSVARLALVLLQGDAKVEDQEVWRLWDEAASRGNRTAEP